MSLSTLPSSHRRIRNRVDDQMSQVKQPLRVVSLLPSATELVWEVLKAASGTVAPQDLPVLVGSTSFLFFVCVCVDMEGSHDLN